MFAVSRMGRVRRISRRSFITSAGALAGMSRAAKAGPAKAGEMSIDSGQCKHPKAHSGVNNLAVSPNGKYAASSGDYETAKLWTLPLGSLIFTFAGLDSWSRAVTFSRNNKYLLTSGDGGKVLVWNLATGKRQKAFSGHEKMVRMLAFTSKGKRLVSADYYDVFYWAFPRGKKLKSWTIGGNIDSLAVSPGGKYLAVGLKNALEIYSLSGDPAGELLKRIDAKYKYSMTSITGLAFSADSKTVIGAAAGEPLKIWSVPKGKLVKSVAVHPNGAAATALSVDGKTLATASYETTAFDAQSTVRIWSFPAMKLLRFFPVSYPHLNHRVESLAFGPDNKSLLVCEESAIQVWNFQSGELIRCMIDMAESYSFDSKGITYTYTGDDGKQVTVTIPDCSCAPPLPSDAVCTCHSVSGNKCTCVGYQCSCVGNCTCVGAHYWFPN